MTDPMAVPGFDRLQARYRITGEVVALSAVRVGAGKAQEISATDQPLIRDGRGLPFLPGSSLKGALRAGLERVLRGLDTESLRACDPLDDKASCSGKTRAWLDSQKPRKPSAEEVLARTLSAHCVACTLFGSSYLAGRIFIRDLPLTSTASIPEVRDGVGIDRDLRNARHKVKYDFEALPPGTTFGLEILLENPSAEHYALALKALELLDQGHILIGGLTSRGLGRVAVRAPKVERTDAQALLRGDGDGYSALDYGGEQTKAGRTLAHVLSGDRG